MDSAVHLSSLVRYFPSHGKAGCCMCDFLIMKYPDMIKMPALVLYGKFSAPKITIPFIFSPLQPEQAS